MEKFTQEEIVNILKRGGVGVLPTDTIYGLVGSALNKHAVAKIRAVKKRPSESRFIILVNSISELELFGVEVTKNIQEALRAVWPGKVSVILPVSPSAGFKRYFYLHQGKRDLAFRLPSKPGLRTILRRTGPLVAPSANISGEPPALKIADAENYFGDSIDFYYSGKTGRAGRASTLAKLVDDEFELIV